MTLTYTADWISLVVSITRIKVSPIPLAVTTPVSLTSAMAVSKLSNFKVPTWFSLIYTLKESSIYALICLVSFGFIVKMMSSTFNAISPTCTIFFLL